MEQVRAEAERMITAIEGDKRLDAVSTPLASWVKKLTRRTSVKNLLSGTWLGHQLHPMLTDLPIGAWVAACKEGANVEATKRLRRANFSRVGVRMRSI